MSQDVWVPSGVRPSKKLLPQAPGQLEAEGAPRIKPGPDIHGPKSPHVGEDVRTWVEVGDPPFTKEDPQQAVLGACWSPLSAPTSAEI